MFNCAVGHVDNADELIKRNIEAQIDEGIARKTESKRCYKEVGENSASIIFMFGLAGWIFKYEVMVLKRQAASREW